VTSRNDAELLRAARQDPEAFREFYDRYAVWIRSWFLRHTGSEPASLDLTAETFAQAWHASRRFRDLADGSGAPWLFGIARHTLLRSLDRRRVEDRARRRLGMPRLELDETQLEALERIHGDDHVAGLLATLPPDEAVAIRARIIDEHGYPEIAAGLRCSEQVVRKRVSRGLARLRAAQEDT
jgi:RNA polymerase sigma-70 factor (ECF subfamily)